MSSTQTVAATCATNAASKKDVPWYAVPSILAILMLSSGGFFLLIAQGISVMSGTNY